MILVHLETVDGKIVAQGYELLDIARRIAAPLRLPVAAVVLGSLGTSAAGTLGAADLVIHADHPRLAEFTPEAHGRALAFIAAERRPDAILLGYSAVGMDMGPFVAARLRLPLFSPCAAAEAGPDGLVATAPLHGGRLSLRGALPWGAVLCFTSGAGNEAAGRSAGSPPIEVIDCAGALEGLRSTVLSRSSPEPGAFDLAQSERILCIGRGLGRAEDVPRVRALAAALGADLAGSRPVVDAGWLPKERQVGKSGTRVSPKLYLALGVSGAPEHLEGMARADFIVAVNSDPDAPIFEVAHLGVVTDLFDLMPELERLAGL